MFGAVHPAGLLRSGALAAGVLATLLLTAGTASAGQPVTQTLNPPAPSDYACMATGGGAICRAENSLTYGPNDTGFACGSGAAAFDIFDQGALTEKKTRYYDVDGNLTRRVIDDFYSSGQWSNPTGGATVDYTQHNTQTDVLAVPGDLQSLVSTITGENIYRAGSGTGTPVFFATGRQVFTFEQSELISSTPHNGFIEAIFLGDPTAFDQVCAALS